MWNKTSSYGQTFPRGLIEAPSWVECGEGRGVPLPTGEGVCTTKPHTDYSLAILIHCVPKEEATELLAIIFGNPNRFSKFLHC